MSEEKVDKYTLTIRLVKSFAFRNIKNLIIHDVDPNIKVSDLKAKVLLVIQSSAAYLPFRNHKFDTFKIFYKAHHNKPNNLVINIDDEGPEFYPKDDQTLIEAGIEHETELTFYNHAEYEEYKKNPETKW